MWIERLMSLILSRPKQWMAFIVALLIVLAPGLIYFEEKYDVRIWFLETDPNIQTLDRFEGQFGNDENMVVALHSKRGLFTPESMQKLVDLTESLWQIPQVQRVDSVTNYNITRVDGDDISIEPLIDIEQEISSLDLASLKEEALTHRVIPNYLLSSDAHAAMIFAPLTPTLEGSPDYERIVMETREIVKSFEGDSDFTVHLIGEAVVNDAFREVSNDDMGLILPLMMIGIIGGLWFLFRSLWAIALAMSVVAFSNLMTLGFAFYTGFTYNQILSILPAILIAISIADSVHVMMTHFQFLGKGHSSLEAMKLSLKKNLLPTILTTVSTTIGFLSLTVTDLLPVRELGLLAALGCVIAWLVTIFFLCPLLSLVSINPAPHFQKMKDIKNSSVKADRYIAWLARWCRPVVGGFSVVMLACLYFTTKVEVNSNPYDYFTDNIPVRHANKFVEKFFGGNAGPELMISTGVEDGIKNPEFLRKVEVLKTWLDQKPYVNKTLDIIDIVKDINQNLNGGDKAFYRIPDTQEEVAEMLFFYSFGLPQGMDLNNRMTLDYESMRMTVLWNINDTRGWLKHVDEIEKKARELGLQLEATGKFLLFQRMMDYVVMTFFQSVLMAMFLVAILMSGLFSSVKLGLLSLVPNILPLIIGAGFMHVVGIPLNIGSAIVASVCLGIAIDDTIHFLSNYYRLRSEGLGIQETMSQIMTFTGSALISTTMLLVACFGLYMIGDFIPTFHFGLLCAVVLTMALLIDLMFLPAVLLLLDKRKQGQKA
jgi:uncharacterized protein